MTCTAVVPDSPAGISQIVLVSTAQIGSGSGAGTVQSRAVIADQQQHRLANGDVLDNLPQR